MCEEQQLQVKTHCVFPELFSLYVLLTLSSFSMHPLFHWHMLVIYLFLAATIFFLHTPLYVSFSYNISKEKKKNIKGQKKKKKKKGLSGAGYSIRMTRIRVNGAQVDPLASCGSPAHLALVSSSFFVAHPVACPQTGTDIRSFLHFLFFSENVRFVIFHSKQALPLTLALIQYAFYFSILCFSLCCFFAQIMLKNMLFALHYAELF